MTVLLVSPDLMFASRFSTAATACGVELRHCLSTAQAAAMILDNPPCLVVADLAMPPSEVELLVQRCGAQCGAQHSHGIRLVAFGPHVQREKLAWADQLGFDRVMTRGEITRGASQLLTDLGSVKE